MRSYIHNPFLECSASVLGSDISIIGHVSGVAGDAHPVHPELRLELKLLLKIIIVSRSPHHCCGVLDVGVVLKEDFAI